MNTDFGSNRPKNDGIKLGLRRAVRRVHKSAYGRAFFVKLGTHTKFDLRNNSLGLFLLFGAN